MSGARADVVVVGAGLAGLACALRLALGEMAGPTLLASTRVRPERLLATGYRFRSPEIEGALRHVLGRPA